MYYKIFGLVLGIIVLFYVAVFSRFTANNTYIVDIRNSYEKLVLRFFDRESLFSRLLYPSSVVVKTINHDTQEYTYRLNGSFLSTFVEDGVPYLVVKVGKSKIFEVKMFDRFAEKGGSMDSVPVRLWLHDSDTYQSLLSVVYYDMSKGTPNIREKGDLRRNESDYLFELIPGDIVDIVIYWKSSERIFSYIDDNAITRINPEMTSIYYDN